MKNTKLKKNTFKSEFRKKLKNVKTFESFSLNEGLSLEFIERIEGITNIKNLETMKKSVKYFADELHDDGFEIEDILEYLKCIINGTV